MQHDTEGLRAATMRPGQDVQDSHDPAVLPTNPHAATYSAQVRSALKVALARGLITVGQPRGATFLIYHRVGGGSRDERDLAPETFARQLDVLADHDVLAIDDALDRLDACDERPSVVLTFDDGFADVYDHAWPLLRERRLPFTMYLATAYVGGRMHWEGSTATAAGSALTWPQIREMVDSGLCTVGNHTHRHVRPEVLSADELDECTAVIEREAGKVPRHFAYPWGIRVERMEGQLAERFRSSVTGDLGRNRPGQHRMRLLRLPVRRTDPLPFFEAKLRGLAAERTYGAVVRVAKAAGARA